MFKPVLLATLTAVTLATTSMMTTASAEETKHTSHHGNAHHQVWKKAYNKGWKHGYKKGFRHGVNYAEGISKNTFKVALWGDSFYNKDEAEKAKEIEQTVSSFNSHDIDFTLFVGDTKNGSSTCTDEAIGDNIVAIFNQINVPTVYSVGDNEWTDCHRTNNGSYDPIERLAFLRDTFFSDDYSQGPNPIELERQVEIPENSRFDKNNVTFASLHVVGSNNNLVVTESQCTKGSERTASDCAAASAEYEVRNAATVEWLKESFAEAKANENVGIVIAIQADPYRVNVGEDYDLFLESLTEENGFTDFFNTLIDETRNFPGQVLFVHGDSHYFRIDKAMFNDDGSITKNFTRVEVFGSKENDWVELTVNPDSDKVFSAEPIILSE